MSFLDAAEGRTCWSVNSSAIAQLCYDAIHTLTITFTDGSQYEITNFPQPVLAQWLGAPSKGAFFNRNVRGKY